MEREGYTTRGMLDHSVLGSTKIGVVARRSFDLGAKHVASASREEKMNQLCLLQGQVA
jgi:hypothetical protein